MFVLLAETVGASPAASAAQPRRRPTIAVVILVRQLRAAGANVFQHADLDAGGRGITAWLANLAGQRPVAHGHG